MDQHRPFAGIADILENRDQLLEIVAVDRADIIEAQFLEERAAGRHAAGELLASCGRASWSRSRKLARETLGEVAQGQIFGRGDQPGEIMRQPAHRRRDRHVVVVQDDDQPVARRLGIVHRLIGHARRHRAVADHRDRLARLAGELVGHREAQRRRDRGRAVGGAERIVFALAPLGEAGQAAALAQGADAVAPAGQDLVRIGLVADVPDQPVVGRVEHIMERDGQLDHAEPRAEMAAGDRDRRDRLRAQLVGELAELLGLQFAQVFGCTDLIEERRYGAVGHCGCIWSLSAAGASEKRLFCRMLLMCRGCAGRAFIRARASQRTR